MGQIANETLALGVILDSTSDGVFVLDGQRRFVWFNQACERLTGWRAEEVIGTGCECSALTQCHDEQGRSLRGLLCPGKAVFEGQAPALRQRMHIQSRGGETRWVETQYTTVRDAEGRPTCIIGVMRDDSEAREREAGWREAVGNLREEIDRLNDQHRERYGFAALLTRSPVMQTVLERIDAACANGSPVLIAGEAGTGKELIARAIHEHSTRREGPFVPASAAVGARDTLDSELFGRPQTGSADASTDDGGLYGAAEGGTLFLEDIDALPIPIQIRLLRVLQDRCVTTAGRAVNRPVNVRLITATRRPVQDLLAAGTLRQDLYYRLAAITIEVPPLRNRREDIPLFVRHFLDELNGASARQIHDVDPEVWRALDAHHWPGNIRELYGVIESSLAAARDGRLQADDLRFWPRMPTTVPDSSSTEHIQLDERLADIERQTILSAIRQAGGQRNLAAKLMGISRSRLYRRMEALGINPDQDA